MSLLNFFGSDVLGPPAASRQPVHSHPCRLRPSPGLLPIPEDCWRIDGAGAGAVVITLETNDGQGGVVGELLRPQTDNEGHVGQVIAQVQAELESLLKQRAEIVKRIGTIRQTIVGLANVFGEESLGAELLELVDRKPQERQTGFTKTCRIVLMEAKGPLTVQEICQEIRERNPALLARHKDPLASVTTVLNRLARYGEARFVLNETRRRAWQWLTDGSDPARA